ncbi:FkbM family methyltransferase [Leptolyngbya sp. AN03gr2]|uniref:FkbM family methyltransferase n=1 Tax=unclassified Leptolyngbya TaxID=2650499 RepID=UPI003D313077
MGTIITQSIVEIGGRTYTICSDDNYVKQLKNRFEPKMVQLFKTLATDSEVILDIGANIGCTALLFGELSKRVYAFEPSQTTFHFLEQNVLQSGLKNISLQNIGLGAEPGEFTLTFSPANRSGGFVSNQTQINAGHVTETITIRPLDEIVRSLNLSKIDFIKIDVEGFEGQVLRGATETLSTYQPIIVLELNHWCLNAFQRTSIPDFFDFLRSTFPILLAIDDSNYLNLHNEDESYTVMYHHILQGNFPNLLAAFNENKLEQFRKLYKHGFAPNSFRSYVRSIKRKIGL